MKNDLDKIAELCDCPWIQGRRPSDVNLNPGLYEENREIWLPINFNAETGRNELDDLLIEVGSADDDWELLDEFWDWLNRKASQDIEYPTSIIAKLTWLNESILSKLEADNDREV